MKSTQVLSFISSISVILFINAAEARLKGEGIFGGDNAIEGQFPYQVSLQAYGSNFCGGSILSDRFVITAAHCVVDDDGTFSTDSVKVVAGTGNLKGNSKDRVVVDVLQVYVPIEYDPTDESNRVITGDIAVLMLDKDLGIKRNSKLAKVKLPEENENYNGVNATVSGFGYNSIDVVFNPETLEREETNGMSFGKLRFASANVLSVEDCQSRFTTQPLSEKHLCAALVQRDSDEPEGLCSGDSGGPLIYNGAQIGVISFSPLGCRENSKPAIYTRVSKYIDFINKVVDGYIDDTIRSTTLSIEY